MSASASGNSGSQELKIPPRLLGQLRMPAFCARCFWIQLKFQGRYPFQIPMPGIFASLDSYGKNFIRTYLDTHGTLPPWFPSIGKVKGTVPGRTLHWSRFQIVDPETRVLLRGTPDDIFIMEDGSHHIVDYKTAKFTDTQDQLLPIYEVQLNAYAMIANQLGLTPIAGISLIYTEPVTLIQPGDPVGELTTTEHLLLRFKATQKKLEIRPDQIVMPLLKKAKDIHDLQIPPPAKENCADCEALRQLLSLGG